MKIAAERKLRVESSKQPDEWQKVFTAETLVIARLHKLMWEETPGVAFYELKAFLCGVRPGWRPVAKTGQVPSDTGGRSTSRKRMGEIYQELEHLRDRMGPDQRKLDLGWIRLVRRDGHLSMFLGGGNRSLRGNIGFMWNLILHLISCAVSISKQSKDSWFQFLSNEMSFLQAFPLSARAICGSARASTLFYREGFTRNLVEYTYMLVNTPGKIHRAIAELAEPVTISNQVHAGLRVIVTQGIDDLLGEAVDDLGLRRRTYTEINGVRIEHTNSSEIVSRSSDLRPGRRARIRTEQMIYHTNGWIPRRTYNEVLLNEFSSLFSSAENDRNGLSHEPPQEDDEKEAYRRLKRLLPSTIFLRDAAAVGTSFRESHVLLLGLSFDDVISERLIAQWNRRDMWPQYFALLRWPTEKMGISYLLASGEDIREACQPFFQHLVQPLWFDSADEIPDLLRELL